MLEQRKLYTDLVTWQLHGTNATMLSIYGCAISNDLLLQMDDIEMSFLQSVKTPLERMLKCESVEFAQSLNV